MCINVHVYIYIRVYQQIYIHKYRYMCVYILKVINYNFVRKQLATLRAVDDCVCQGAGAGPAQSHAGGWASTSSLDDSTRAVPVTSFPA